MKRRMHVSGERASMLVVERFQNVADRPYRLLSGAAAILADANQRFRQRRLSSPARSDDPQKFTGFKREGNSLKGQPITSGRGHDNAIQLQAA